MTLSSFVLPHIIAGGLALILFWIAVLNRKGTRFHRRIGQSYLLCMLFVIVTGVPLTVHLFLTGHAITGVFLSYLIVLVSWSCAGSLRAIRFRQDIEGFYGRWHRLGAVVLALSGIIVMGVGFKSSAAFILIPFGAIGPLAALALYRDLRRQNHPANWWLKEHYSAMIGNGVATHIAFTQIGLSRMLPENYNLVLMLGWLLPLAVGIVAGIVLDRRYQSSTARIISPLRTASD